MRGRCTRRLELLKARKVAKTLVHDGNNRRLDFIELGNGSRALLARAIRAVVGGGELLLDALRLIGRIASGFSMGNSLTISVNEVIKP